MILYDKSLESFQKNYIGYVALIVIGQSCLGSAAAMYTLKNGTSILQMIQLGIVVGICMMVNVAILAQLTPKTVYNMTILSVIVSALTIILNLLVF
ncbi:hypothetical protein [Flavobacterium sp.]|uniref:hypothetical protein n=1 Tax=Flavobacterium sp. TaxID=239 RepID=UPI0024897ED6|nr:hypothetical protein [Flavobacterium sp.]MDI1317720.1 hypothetical protein [Flavobacterium sp.]